MSYRGRGPVEVPGLRRRVGGVRSAELADTVGVNVETLRYYERRGLLPVPPRRPSGYRDFPPDAVDRLRRIKQAQALGLTLQEITELLALNPHTDIACGDMETRIRSKITDLDTTMVALGELREQLEQLLCACCDGQQTNRACPALENHRS